MNMNTINKYEIKTSKFKYIDFSSVKLKLNSVDLIV